MIIFFIIKKDFDLNNIKDINIKDIYGIYQNKCKAFWECKIINLNNNKIVNNYVLLELNLNNFKIINIYNLFDRNYIIDINLNKYKIKTSYNNLLINI